MTGWPAAYRPLQPRTLLGQLALVVAAEIALFTSYRGHDAGFHWSTHFLVALVAWSVLNLAWLSVKAAPARGQLVSLLALHLLAVVPDLLFFARVEPHEAWMDVFLGHLSAHYIPGGDDTWLALGLLVSGGYLGVLAAWLRARHIEAAAGQAPGVGIGGAGIVRPQADPRTTLLHHHVRGERRPPDVLLVHGLAASTEVWSQIAPRLADRGHGVLACDLLGFGRSRRIGTEFGLDAQTDALTRLLDHHGASVVKVVGHSWGCAAGARLAERHPERVGQLVLVSPPVFRDADQARERLGRRGWLARQVLRRTPVASAVCGAMCLLREPLGRLAPRLSSRLPAALARDSVQHSWPAYRDAIASLFDDNPLPAALQHPSVPTLVVVAEDDPQTPAEDVLGYPHGVQVELLAGDHLLPLRRGEAVTAVIDGA